MISDKTLHRLSVFFIILTAIIALGYSVFYIYSSQFQAQPILPVEQPEIEASYDAESEELELEIADGWFTNWRSSYVKFEQNDTDTFTLRSNGEEKETVYWAKDGILALNSEGLVRFPLRHGATVTLDMERPRILMIRTLAESQEVTSHHVVFKDCEPEVHATMYMDWENEEEWMEANQPQDC